MADGISLRLMAVEELRIDSTSYELDLTQTALVAANIFVVVFPVVQTLVDIYGAAMVQWSGRLKQLMKQQLSRAGTNMAAALSTLLSRLRLSMTKSRVDSSSAA